MDVFTEKTAVGGTIPSPLGPWAVLDLYFSLPLVLVSPAHIVPVWESYLLSDFLSKVKAEFKAQLGKGHAGHLK